MDQLGIVLRLTKKIDVDYLVLERLLAVSRSMPLETLRCIRLLCEGAEKQWEIPSWLEEIKKILMVVTRSKRRLAREEALELAEYLTAKGYRYFDEILDDAESTA